MRSPENLTWSDWKHFLTVRWRLIRKAVPVLRTTKRKAKSPPYDPYGIGLSGAVIGGIAAAQRARQQQAATAANQAMLQRAMSQQALGQYQNYLGQLQAKQSVEQRAKCVQSVPERLRQLRVE